MLFVINIGLMAAESSFKLDNVSVNLSHCMVITPKLKLLTVRFISLHAVSHSHLQLCFIILGPR